MKIYETKDYQEMSRPAANISFSTGYFKAGLCTGSGRQQVRHRSEHTIS